MQNALKNRAILEASGEDIIEFLGGQVTSDIFNLKADQCQHALLLTPQGKILADLFLYQIEDQIYVELESEIKDWFLMRMKMYKLRSDVHFTEMPNLHMHLSFEAQSNAMISQFDPRLKTKIYRNIIQADEAIEAQDFDIFEAIFLENAIVDFGVHYKAEQYFPSDLWFDQLGSVNYKKGCYIGQEVVSRMKHKSSALKRLMVLNAKVEIRAGDEVIQNARKLANVFYAKKFEDGYLILFVTRSDKIDPDALIFNQHEQFMTLLSKGSDDAK